MPSPRKELLVNGEVYHIFNKSIADQEIFTAKWDLNRLMNLITYLRLPQNLRYSKFKTLSNEVKENYESNIKKQTPLVEIYAFAIMPNHYHLLLKQITDDGISTFISKLQNSFAKFYNEKYDRLGGLFLRPFSSKRITTDEILLHISRYIHLNPVTSYLIKYENLKSYPWTSYPDYIKPENNELLNTELILGLAGSTENYESFVRNQADYQQKLNKIKKFIIE